MEPPGVQRRSRLRKELRRFVISSAARNLARKRTPLRDSSLADVRDELAQCRDEEYNERAMDHARLAELKLRQRTG